MTVEKGIFGNIDKNKSVEYFVLKNKSGMEAKVITLGATLVSLTAADKNGKFADVVLGYDDAASYMDNSCYFGCTVGRIANRIKDAKFKLDGREYKLTVNSGKNQLHGGIVGFGRVLWKAEPFAEGNGGQGVLFKYSSPDGEEGYPGNLDVKVTYTLTDDNELKIEYVAVTDKTTVVNLTNHSYFNLAGHNSGRDILSHQLQINSDTITESDSDLIATGKLAKVENTAYDFRKPKALGADIKKLDNGYDINYVLIKKSLAELSFTAKAVEPNSGRVMEIYTTEPGVQLYTGNFLDGIKGKGGAVYNKQTAFCLETQHYADSPNKPEFPSVVLRPGETYRHLTVHKFSVQ
ncbi:MAG: galactose mutarotase [Planctomycetaceae bacterium]|nr:galactose mutarotase [Planctomycetaceae bacterium]